jgi:enamine deaminase RidA (YjgF/YER057c/UK114 family)
MSVIAKRLAELGITLPQPPAAVAAYVPYVVTGNLVFISGQVPIAADGTRITGHVGQELDIAAGQKAARLCALNVIAQLNAACGGSLDKVERCVKLGGFIASAPGFYEQPKVMNGASELMQQVFGEAGKHARFAVGASNLPFNVAVEVDAIFALRG